jgi:hypothetical protein
MHKFIIVQDWNSFDTIWHYDPDPSQLERKVICLPITKGKVVRLGPIYDVLYTYVNDNKVPLLKTIPIELKFKCMMNCISDRMTEHKLEEAMSLISMHRDLVHAFYGYFFRTESHMTVVQKHLRISRCFYLLQVIFDCYLTDLNRVKSRFTFIDFEPASVAMGSNLLVGGPWDYVTTTRMLDPAIDIMETCKPIRCDGEHFTSYCTGPFYSDVIWMQGQSLKGVMTAKSFKQPVINLILSNQNGDVIPTIRDLEYMDWWKSFSSLMVYCYGPNTGVNFAVAGDHSGSRYEQHMTAEGEFYITSLL